MGKDAIPVSDFGSLPDIKIVLTTSEN